MITPTTIRTAKALVWACALAAIIIIGIGTAQSITFRAIIFVIALLPVSAAILIGSFINDHNHGEFNG